VHLVGSHYKNIMTNSWPSTSLQLTGFVNFLLWCCWVV